MHPHHQRDDDSLDKCGGDEMLIKVPGVRLLATADQHHPVAVVGYHLTILRGHNVDQPRNLAKSVTVE